MTAKTRWRPNDTVIPQAVPRVTHMADLGLVRLAFALGSEVILKGPRLEAVVVTASVTTRGVVYQCAWWNDKSRSEAWFEEFELEAKP
jgi:uncharacterized protein YodC (DUF2158 family)